MGSLDFGKLTTIIILFFSGMYFFGGEAMYWYDHKEDLQFSFSETVYTKADFNEMSQVEQKALLEEVESICVRKHNIDKLSCDDTGYWLADGLEEDGVDIDLAMEWMTPCVEACKNRKAPPTLMDRPGKRTKL